MPPVVRRSEVADAQRLRQLRLEALQDAPLAYGTRYVDVVRWSDEQWLEFAADPALFVAERDGELVGMARGGTSSYDEPGAPARWLYGMYVTSRVRGDGTASALVEAVADWARHEGATSLHLHVTRDAPRAHAFYRKIGFVDHGDPVIHDSRPDITLLPMVRYL